MKTDIHPKYKKIKVKCACGNEFEVNSSSIRDEIEIDSCSQCHPVYTGGERNLDTVGRVEKFKQRLQKAQQQQQKKEIL
ncbi:50S ribosomal protein L31 [bacterium HR34]|nr:50S ribosomal protein L31 [bacterium HR34]